MRDYALDWTLVDVETSGFRPTQHRVLSIAMLAIGPDGKVTGQFSSLLNPGCDPGPVHIHGLTPQRLAGAPKFEEIAPEIAALLKGRVMVAHNARFDYDFLFQEFTRAGLRLPVDKRLCTLALNRRLSPPTRNMRLGTLAAHYGVTQRRAHDAKDDTRVLAGVLQGSLAAAAELGLSLPLVPCPPRQASARPRYPASVPKVPCPYRNPGRLTGGGPLVQGMKVAITGDTRTPRAELTAKGAAAGLNMMSTVSRHTSVLVTNAPTPASAKAKRAADEGVPTIDEATFLRLLQDVRPGTPHEPATPPPPTTPTPRPPAEPRPRAGEPAPPPRKPTPPAHQAASPAAETASPVRGVAPPADSMTPPPHEAAPPAGAVTPPAREAASPPDNTTLPARQAGSSAGEAVPWGREGAHGAVAGSRPVAKGLSGRRVLVLGGSHPRAAAARTRVTELGGAAAVNLSSSVTDAVVLPGGDEDRRMPRIRSLGLPLHDEAWLYAPESARPAGREAGPARPSPLTLPRGGVIDLPVTPHTAVWTVTATWAHRTSCEVDIVAFALDGDEQVSCDEDFVFYGAPETPGGAVSLSADGPAEQAITVDTGSLGPSVRKVLIAAAIDGTETFGTVGAIEITAAPGTSEAPLAQATLDAATTERTMLLAEVYRRGPAWRLRAIGQGHDYGLDSLARAYGVDVDD